VVLFSFGRRTRLAHDVGASARNADERWAAEERAQELLRAWLSPEQRKQYDQRASFEVVGSDTGKRYRICKGHVFNIQELDTHGIEIRAWCVTADGVATGDINLAQKIALETFEGEVLAIANRSEGSVWPAGDRPSATSRSWMRRSYVRTTSGRPTRARQ
jgi:hypothetical protein